MSQQSNQSPDAAGAPARHATRNSPTARVLGFLAYVVCFLRELVLANISMAKAVLFQKREDLAPGFVSYPLAGLSKLEVLMLTHSITLTPGTTSVEISGDGAELVVHAFDARDADAVRASIRNGLEKPLLAWTR
jgi:multicomponent Na+:H+ antiporter subunit E